jgi:hypothetical protein
MPEISHSANSVEEWIILCQRYRNDAQALRDSRNPNGSWLAAGFSIECCLKAAIMKRERFNRWPERATTPELWTHDLRSLFKRLGVDPAAFDPKNQVAPALKMALDWRREHGYSLEKMPDRLARDMCRAAFDGDGVIEWIARRYQLNI